MSLIDRRVMTVYGPHPQELASKHLPAGRSRWTASVRIEPAQRPEDVGMCLVSATFDVDSEARKVERSDASDLDAGAPVRVWLEGRLGIVTLMVAIKGSPATFRVGSFRQLEKPAHA